MFCLNTTSPNDFGVDSIESPNSLQAIESSTFPKITDYNSRL